MNRTYLPMGQGIPADSKGSIEWPYSYRTLSDADRCEFLCSPSAPFIVRELEREDVLPRSSRGAGRRGARPLVIVTRSGHRRIARQKPGWFALGHAIADAEAALLESPALGADALPDATLCLLQPGSVSPMISGAIYVHAPGVMSLCGVFGPRIYKQFDPRKISIVDLYSIGATQALYDRQRGFDQRRLNGCDAAFVFPRSVIRARKRRRAAP